MRSALTSSSRASGAISGSLQDADRPSPVGDADHRRGERVERLARLRLGRFDHQRLWDDEREVHGRRVEPFVDERLADIERGHAQLFLPRR